MISRELLTSQPVLNTFNASKTAKLEVQTTSLGSPSFESVLNQKNQSSLEKKSEVQKTTPEQTLKPTDESAKQIKQDSKSDEDVAVEESTTESLSESKKATENDVASETPTDKELNLMAFKELLKKKTGLSDEEIEQLMTLMGTEFQELISNTPVEMMVELDFSNLVEASNILQNMEVNQLLQEPVDEMLTSELNEALKSFVQTLLQKNVGTSDKATSEKFTETLVNKIGENVDALTVSMQEDNQKTLKQILNEMNKNQSSSVLSPETETKDTTVKTVVDTVTVDEKSEKVETGKTSAVEPSASKTDQKDQMTPADVSVETDDGDMVVQQSQDQKIVETTLKNMEIRQIPKQEIFTQVMEGIKGNLTVNELGSHLSIKLQPEQLGEVELKLTMHKGVVLAEIKVENETVKAAIETNLDQLKQSLTQKGYQTSGISVSVDSGKKENDQTSQQQQFKLKRKVNEVTHDEATSFLEKIALNYNDDMVDATSTIDFFG
jgi:flagellar hook-length control protein FliK